MPSPVTAVGPASADPSATPRPASPPGDFEGALRVALEGSGGPPRPTSGVGPRPATVPLGRMLAVLGGTTDAASPVAPTSSGPAAVSPLARAERASAGSAIVAQARNYLGVPYRWGGTDPATGLDCSGLVQQVFDDLGVSVPRTSAQQATVGSPVGSLADARPGDLLFWASSRPGQSNHIGIHVGGGQMLHAPYTGEVVKIAPVRSEPPTTIRRLAIG